MSAADHDVKPGDSQDEVCKCGHLHAEHYGKVATARCTVCEGPARPVEDREPFVHPFPSAGSWQAAEADRVAKDREPVGPYAPTRTSQFIGHHEGGRWVLTSAEYQDLQDGRFEAGYRQGWRERHVYGTPRYKGLPTLTNRPEGGTELGDYLVEQFGSVGTRLDGLVDVVLRQETRITEAMNRLSQLVNGGALRKAEKEFERGRQQGDADRVQRGVSEFERGKTVGAIQRESELLDQGWTPPGAITVPLLSSSLASNDQAVEAGWEGARMMGAETPYSVVGGIINAAIPHLSGAYIAVAQSRPFLSIDAEDVEVTSGPADYEVWRDALMIAASFVSGDGADYSEVEGIAEITRDKLINYPTISPDEADQHVKDYVDRMNAEPDNGE